MKFISLLLLSLPFISSTNVDKASFYEAFESDSKAKMELQISKLKDLKSSTIKDAYIGALTMKKAQYMKSPRDKSTVFKKGALLLEGAIGVSSENGEYRFLRLVIQENSPKILKYNTNIKEDVAVILKKFSGLDTHVKKAIRKYAKQSKNLPSDKLK